MQRKPQRNLKDNRNQEYAKEDKNKIHNNRFEPLLEDKDSNEDSDLTLRNGNMIRDEKIQYNKEEKRRN